MSITRRFVASAICVGLGGVFAAAAPASSAQAATTYCTTYSSGYRGPNNLEYSIPSANVGTGSFDVFCILNQGNTGLGVDILQQTLNLCYGQKLSVDRNYGPATRSAVIAVQRRVGVTADGVYGFNTEEAMQHIISGGGAVPCGVRGGSIEDTTPYG